LHVHFVNLDRSTDRLAEFKAVNAHLAEVTRIPAIEEHRIDIQALTQQGLVHGDILSMYPIGAVCQALSHRALWTKAIESDGPITISDDDAIFNFKFDAVAAEVIKNLPHDWDVILWGWNFDLFMIFDMLPGVSPCVCQFDQDKMRLNTRTFQQLPVSPRAHKLIWSFGHTSYTVSPKGARILKSGCFPLRPMLVPCPEGIRTPPHSLNYRNVGLDNTLNSLYRHLNAFICFPPLVISTNEHSKSTIQVKKPAAAKRSTDDTLEEQGRIPSNKMDEIFALSKEGLELYRHQRVDAALNTFDKVLALDPTVAESHYNRGNILGDLNRFDQALEAYDNALKLKPDFIFALNNRGLILQKLRRYEEALANYDKALAINPDYADAKVNRDLLLRVWS
jgi:glycosyl transferase, family 25